MKTAIKRTFTQVLGNGNAIEYKELENGTCYHAETPEGVIEHLEESRIFGRRIRVFYGDTATGLDWFEEHDTMGRVGRSTGDNKIPLLVHNSRSFGGGAILDHCIVRITMDGRNMYLHPKYHQLELTILDLTEFADGYADELAEGYTHQVRTDDDVQANFKDYKKASNYVRFLEGKRNSK